MRAAGVAVLVGLAAGAMSATAAASPLPGLEPGVHQRDDIGDQQPRCDAELWAGKLDGAHYEQSRQVFVHDGEVVFRVTDYDGKLIVHDVTDMVILDFDPDRLHLLYDRAHGSRFVEAKCG